MSARIFAARVIPFVKRARDSNLCRNRREGILMLKQLIQKTLKNNTLQTKKETLVKGNGYPIEIPGS